MFTFSYVSKTEWNALLTRCLTQKQGGITCAMPAGSLIGALASGFLGDKIGRKYAIQIGGVIWIIGSM